MKKHFIQDLLFIFAIFLIFYILNANVFAATVAQPYYSEAEASYTIYPDPNTENGENYYATEDSTGDQYAHVETNTPYGYATSSIKEWEIHAKTYVDWAKWEGEGDIELINLLGTYNSRGYFEQKFKVVSPGEAKINFSYSGRLFVDRSLASLGKYEVGFSVYAWDNLEENLYKKEKKLVAEPPIEIEDPPNPIIENYNDNFSFDYNFSEQDIGRVFFISLELKTWAKKVDPDWPNAALESNFYDTLKVVNYSGGITPVPIPGSVWLLITGMFFIFFYSLTKKSLKLA